MTETESLRDGDIACSCVGLTVGDVRRVMAESGQIDFDRLQDITNAGRKCTACLLDLELLFVDSSRHAARPGPGAASERESGHDQVRTLKQRLYGILDSLPVFVPFHEPNFMPLLHGPGISTRLWLANYSLLYGADLPPEFTVRIRVRDGAGNIVRAEERRLAPQSELRFEASRFLPAADDVTPYGRFGISAGSLEVDRIAGRPGVRGTTRPQVEFVSPGGSSTLHTQGLGKTMNRRFTCYHRPDVERIFFTVISDADEPRRVGLRVREMTDTGPTRLLLSRDTIVPARGTGIVPLRLDGEPDIPGGALVECHIEGALGGKVHAVCGAPDFSMLSFDHI